MSDRFYEMAFVHFPLGEHHRDCLIEYGRDINGKEDEPTMEHAAECTCYIKDEAVRLATKFREIHNAAIEKSGDALPLHPRQREQAILREASRRIELLKVPL